MSFQRSDAIHWWTGSLMIYLERGRDNGTKITSWMV